MVRSSFSWLRSVTVLSLLVMAGTLSVSAQSPIPERSVIKEFSVPCGSIGNPFFRKDCAPIVVPFAVSSKANVAIYVLQNISSNKQCIPLAAIVSLGGKNQKTVRLQKTSNEMLLAKFTGVSAGNQTLTLTGLAMGYDCGGWKQGSTTAWSGVIRIAIQEQLPPPPTTQCSDGIDNDKDGQIDFSRDRGCSSTTDTNEADGPTDIALIMVGSPVARPTNVARYTVVLRNAGPDAATSPIAFKVSIPEHFTVNQQLLDSSCRVDTTSIVCNGITMRANEVRIFPFTYSPSSLACGPIVVAAKVTETPQGDPNPNNNEASVKTIVTCPPPPPSSSASLFIAQKALATTDTAVKNQKNVTLLRFEGRAENQDILLTKASFVAAQGSLNNAQNYTVWADTDGDSAVDTILEKGVNAQSNKVVFSQMIGGGFVIPKTRTVMFEIRADIAASLTSDSVQLGFATADSDYIQAEQVDRGSSLAGIKTNGVCNNGDACAIVVTIVPATRYLLFSQGNLYVTKDQSKTLRNRQLLGGTLAEEILRLNFRAEHENIDVTDLQFTSIASNGVSLDRLELYKEGATAPFATATIGGCGGDQVPANTFCSKMQNRQLVVKKNEPDVRILVRPRMKSDVEGAVSNQEIQIAALGRAISNNATGEGAVRARGDVSSNNLYANNQNGIADGEVFIGGINSTASNADIVGARNVTVLSKIITIANANPDANGSSVPTAVSEIGQFKFSAAAHNNSKNGLNKVILNGLYFNVNAVNVTMNASDFKFFNKSNASTTQACSAVSLTGDPLSGDITGSFLVKCLALNSVTAPNTQIEQGSDQTFVLQVNIANNDVVASSTSALQVSLQNFSEATLQNNFGPTGSHIEWLDNDGDAFSTNGTTTNSSFNWVEYGDTVVKSTAYQS